MTNTHGCMTNTQAWILVALVAALLFLEIVRGP